MPEHVFVMDLDPPSAAPPQQISSAASADQTMGAIARPRTSEEIPRSLENIHLAMRSSAAGP
jgi:hypothetical protein